MKRFLIIGLGSMGKRRIRNLRALGYDDITGFDLRAERREEAEGDFGICTVTDLHTIDEFDAVVISTSPAHHTAYIQLAIEKGKPCFVELSLLVQNLPDLDRTSRAKGVLVAPSCTFRFHPSVRLIKRLVESGDYGRVTSFTYHSGQYLPDWHPWENIRDFFVSKKETSGCKEILSFELHWMTYVLGMPRNLIALSGRAATLDIDIDDAVAVSMEFDRGIGVLFADTVSRFATRSLILNLERAQLRWDWEQKLVRLYDADTKQWTGYPEPEGHAHSGYNAGIVEQMYIGELQTFIEAAERGRPFPLSLSDTIRILELIEAIEENSYATKSAGGKR
ncbi:MAG: Gfo/Idh/MocA family oxidoreductase [Nitrospirota bacterium]